MTKKKHRKTFFCSYNHIGEAVVRGLGIEGAIVLYQDTQKYISTKKSPNFCIFLPRTLLGSLTTAIQGSGMSPAPERSALSKTNS